MNILFTRFPKESAQGGAENQTEWLVRGLIQHGHVVRFLGHCPVLKQRFDAVGIASTFMNIGEPPVTKWGVCSFLWKKKRMRQLLVEGVEKVMQHSGQLDVICMLSLSEKLLLTPWCIRQGIRVIWMEHDPIGRWLRWNPWRLLLQRFSSSVTTICVSESAKRDYGALGYSPEHICVIPNGVPSAEPNPVAESPKTLRIGTIARLAHEKGVDILLEALRPLEGVSLSIVGQGREEASIKRMIDEDVLETGQKRITLTASLPSLEAWYESIDVLVLPSRTDPFGLVVAEAMMRGIPVLVTDRCGVADVLTHAYDALIVQSECPHALSEALCHLKDPLFRQALSTHGRMTAEKHFSLPAMIAAYETVLREGGVKRLHQLS
jgi:glycosyltransferase involved in cell wall biosynthesis